MATIKDVDRKLLWVKSGDKCAFTGCHQELTVNVSESSERRKLVIIGEEAHIVAKEDDGPRGDPSMPSVERNSHENLLLLCPTHHTLIDKEKGANFSVETLLEMKRIHEESVAAQRNSNSDASLHTRRDSLLSGLSASRARLVSRWIAVGVDPDKAEELADDNSIGRSEAFANFYPEKKIAVLLGDFGSGKTVALEREYQAYALTALEDPKAPFPLYFNSRNLGSGFQQSIDDQITRSGSPQTHTTIFLDGLDEFGLERSLEIVDELRSWVFAGHKRKVLATSRNAENLTNGEYISLPPLTDEELVALLEKIGADRSLAWGTPSDISDALHRPLFALIAADCRKAGSAVPNSRGSFLEALVERALSRTSHFNDDAHSLLVKLGRLTINSGGTVASSEVGGKGDQRKLIETRLVTSKGRVLSFTLPVLGQYFAGQYVLENGLPEIAGFSARKRDQWREAIVFAVSAGSWSSVNRLLSDLATADPGLSAWVTTKAIPSYEQNPTAHLPDSLECATRLQTARDKWLSEIGPIGSLLQNPEISITSAPLAVATDEERPGSLSVAFIDPASCSPGELTVEITGEVDTKRGEIDGRKILGTVWGTMPSSFSAWPWMLSLKWVRNGISALLKHRALPLSENAAFQEEEVWSIARNLTEQKGFTHRPIPCSAVISKIDEAFEWFPDLTHLSVGKNLIMSRGQLEDLRKKCASNELPNIRDGEFHRPYPVTDIDPGQGSGHIASCYSDPTLRDLVEQVYTNALSIYEGLVRTYMHPLKRTLHLGGASPVAFQCKLSRAPEGAWRIGGEPMFSRVVVPLPVESSSQVSVEFVENLYNEPEYSSGRINIPGMNRATFRRMRPDSVSWSSPSVSLERLDLFNNSPATSLAYKWLWNDLKQIGLTEGIAPNDS
ncbi:HNH endonuclease signature motif containing protein [Streptomyces sp. PpalLS-921]|uniref:HNH endonuclease signature motif containing protein n=1 Tax=Streptomyces sp. PpalLS-921 TaxID=1839772 RepID=UPI00081DB7AE|nr:HNH endonuclease signature motif containing protein [Streptomyces sp. PpalLS-921]SCD64567.1 HNH endonuclease [Streptomyces sp. PpalLS-921]